jgi:hypothetical protein
MSLRLRDDRQLCRHVQPRPGLRLQPINGRTTDNTDDTDLQWKQEFEQELTGEAETDARGSVISVDSCSIFLFPAFCSQSGGNEKYGRKIWGKKIAS